MSIVFSWFLVAVAAAASASAAHASGGGFSLRILHTNDMHCRFEEMSKFGGKCTESDSKKNLCYGGYPRLLTAVKQHREKARAEGIPILFLNAGDTFQGTAWYTVHKWKVVANLTNMLTIDAASLGNHEFDDGVQGLIPFLGEAQFPNLACNLGLEDEPELAASRLLPSVVLNASGHSVGVIGYLTPETTAISRTGKVKIYDEIDRITREAKKLKDEGVDVVIAVGHSGFETDLRIAQEVPYVDVVVGGHTNTFLYTGKPPDSEIPASPYPRMVIQSTGRKVAAVQAYAYTKYLGVLNLTFDDEGELLTASGNPQLLNYEVAEDPDMLEALVPWRKEVVSLTERKLGKTKVFLDGDCRYFECNMGNLITDAFVHYAVSKHSGPGWTNAPIAIQQGGGIRTSVDASTRSGTIIVEDIITVLPFHNFLDLISIKGKHLLEALEWSVTRYDPHHHLGRGEFLQFSGLRVTYDLTQPPGKRVVEALARCGDCTIPKMAAIEKEATYNVLMPAFLSVGGDNYTMIADHGKPLMSYDRMDTHIVMDFIEERKLVYPELEDRIRFVDYNKPDNSPSAADVRRCPWILPLLSFFVSFICTEKYLL